MRYTVTDFRVAYTLTRDLFGISMTSRFALALAFASLGMASPASHAHAQNTGLELSLYGTTQAAYGGALRLSGVVFQTQGYAELRPLGGAQVEARVRDYDSARRRWDTVETVTVRADATGAFEFVLEVPERRFRQAQLQIEVSGGGKQRTFDYPIGLRSPLAFDLLLDRNRYEPGETVHLWSRLHRLEDGAPVAGRTVAVRVHDPSGRPLVERSIEVSASGAATLDFELPDSAVDGVYAVDLRLDDSIAGASARRVFQVARRTVERLLVETTIDQRVVPPSGQITGRVIVTTPSGAPVVGADVQLQIGSDTRQRQTVRTNGEGVAAIRMQAPAYLAGDVEAQSLQVRVQHPAHGTLHSSASFLLSRVEWQVSATAANGAIVPEVDTEVVIAVTDPRGEPAPAGTKVTVQGDAIRGGSREVEIDAHGLALVPVRVRDGDAGPLRGNDPGCNGISGVRIEVDVQTERPAFARVCLPVNPKARVRPRVVTTVVEPGALVEVDVERHPEVRNRPVLVEALAEDIAVAAAFATGGRARIQLPPGVAGIVQIRARPLMPHDAQHPLDQPGGSSLGTGAYDAVLVRPGDAFGFAIGRERETYRVRETAQLGLRTTQSSPQAWATLVARDLAAHGGETPYAIAWMRGALDAAVTAPDEEGNDLLLRAALLRSLPQDGEPRREPPLVQPYWRDAFPGGGQGGTLRDPVADRDRMRRRQVGQLMMQLERFVSSWDLDRAVNDGLLVRRGNGYDFHPDAIENLVRARQLGEAISDTIGGDTASIAMIRAVDASFSFDAVARRIARARLVQLMMAISRFTNPDDANAARASQGQPPERWLSTMVQLGVLQPAQLLDPWGHPFEFRRAGTPQIVLTDRAPTWQLVSAGPDGRMGTRDDVNNPFERLVAEGTPYAVVSGEDQLMKALSTLAPGPRVLQAMATAYASMSLQALEEQRQRAVSANASEGDAELADAMMLGGLDGGGYGRGAGGAMAQGAPRRSARAMPASPAADSPAEEAMYDEDGEPEPEMAREREERNAQDRTDAFANLNTIVRERFPATLLFIGEVALDGTLTTVPLELADALTTYRVEAIAWTASGWLTTASVDVKVDQEATVDAPTPPFGTVGDAVSLPIRVGNRTRQPLEVRVIVEHEGAGGVSIPEPITITVPPRDAVESTVAVQLTGEGSGSLLIRAVRASDERPLDAVRRPLTVWSDARLVRVRRELLLVDSSGAELTLEVPADASDRGAGELRVLPATAIFGDITQLTHPSVGWALALVGETPPEALLINARRTLQAGDPVEDHHVHGPPAVLAMAAATVWNDATVQDQVLRRALRSISRILGDPTETPTRAQVMSTSEVLAALAPCVRDGRPAVRTVLIELTEQLKRYAGSAVAQSDAPVVWARAATALALVGSDTRARELLRRAERHIVRLDGEAFLEEPGQAGVPIARIAPTAMMAIAWAALDDRERAMSYLRHLVSLHRGAEGWEAESRVLAAAAAGTVAGRGVREEPRGSYDGSALSFRALDASPESRIRVSELPSATPGRHTVRVEGPSLALVYLDVRYGRPWSATPERSARLDLEIEGALGPRDARAGLALTVRNRAPRLATAPVIEIDLPAGTELDEPTRAVLRELTIDEPTVEGRTLQLRLRPLAPGGRARIPLPLRWSVGGTLRGLGVSAYDDATAPSTDVRPLSVLPSRELTIADEGAEPEQAEAESSPVPEPPPPPPPLPRPIDAFGPVAMFDLFAVEGGARC